MWFTKLIKQFFFWIDKIVYNFIPAIYDLLLDIARTSILTQADIADMADRIYKLLAIFMIFKVTLSLITYVVNPDDFSDKTKGVAKLGTNIIISLSLLILTPYIFNYAYQLQTIILEDNSLATLVFGDDLGEESFLNTAGDEMAYISMNAFFTPNLSMGNLHDCTTLYEPVYNEAGNSDGKKFNDACKTALEALPTDNFSSTTLQNYVAGVENSNLGLVFRQDLVLATAKPEGATEEDFVMDYKFIFSTVVGVVIILLLITFCMDVAVRSLKLAFFQLIAPIPILSYVDPKSGKDGLFKKWYEMCFKTFLSLFIRLLALYFAVYIISKVGDMQLVDIVDGSYKSGFLLYVFVIIGALMFAKQLPEILKGLGIKLDGDGKFTLNPLRKMEKEALGGGILKKPNDALAKFGKGVLKSPFTGASLGARKLMAGVDSAVHGKGFINGTKNVKGKIAQAKDKFVEKNLPHTYKQAKTAKEGRENLKLRDKRQHMGEKYWSNSKGAMDKETFLNDVDSAYAESWRKVDKKKVAMYEANAKADTYTNLINNGRLNGEDRNKLARELGLSETASDSELIQGLSKYKGTAEKQYNEAKSRHDEIKKQYWKSAEKEEAYDYYDKMHSGNKNLSNAPSYNGADVTGGDTTSQTPSSTGGSNPSGSTVTPSSNGSTGTPSSTTSSNSENNSEEIISSEKERAKNIHEYEIEKLKKQVEELKNQLDEREEVINRTIANFEKVVDSLKEQKMTQKDASSIEVINKQIDEYTELIEKEKNNLKQVEDDYNSKIKYLEERISLLTNGV